MGIVDNTRLYDLSVRKQIYIEGVKEDYSKEFESSMKELGLILTAILSRVKYKTLDGLTKAELNRLLVSVRVSQTRIYSDYTQKIIDKLYEFMQADLNVTRRVFVSAHNDSIEGAATTNVTSDLASIRYIEEQKKGNGFLALFGLAAITGNDSRLWSTVLNTPIPANGIYPIAFINGFNIQAQATVENIIRKAYANKQDVAGTVAELTKAYEGTSVLGKLATQSSAVTATIMQHIDAITTAGVNSQLFEKYQWHSVIDGRTTDICRFRNRKIYTYGKGPLPPAHIRCRSHIAPLVGDSDILPEGFYGWLVRQPVRIQDDVLSKASGDKLRAGKIKAEDIAKYENPKPLTLQEFKDKINSIVLTNT